MKKLLLIASLSLCGCAHQPPPIVSFDLPEKAQSISVAVEDLRPENEKKKEDETFSLSVVRAGYGITRVGDETTSPPITDVFRWMVFERLGGTEKDLKISIHHMVVYLNAKSRMRRQSVGAGIGVLFGGVGILAGASIGGNTTASTVNISQSLVDREQFERNSRAEPRHAFYSKEENPENAPVFVTYIDATVNGKRIFVRTMAPITAPEGQFAFVLAVKGAIQYWLDQYSDSQPGKLE